MNRRFTVLARARRHSRLLLDVATLSGWFATHGRTSISDGSGLVGDFERAFARMTESSFALAMNSGTAALHSAYFAVGVGPGTEVIVPSYTWHASATPVLQCGAIPVFCDIDPQTLTMDVDDMSRRITERTRAICVVHTWGNPAELDRILTVARAHGLAVVEDCSHAHGARYGVKPVGSWGDVGCFSLHASKPVAGGEGGVAVTDDPVLFDRMLLLGHVGRLGAGQAASTFQPDDVDLGVKYRPHLFAIHLARSQLKRLPAENARRARLWALIRKELDGASSLTPVQTLPMSERGGYYRFVVEHVGDRGAAGTDEVVRVARSRGVPVTVEPYGRNLVHTSWVFSTLDRVQLGGGCFDATRPLEENMWTTPLPVCEDIGPRLIAFDQLTYLASERFVARSARELCRAAGG
ncbi:MAG: perosamine synthetase [Solirubrobacteraceae bacterium]|nr:perosamine synthetase [Solirubrobacteraceae bacterium]